MKESKKIDLDNIIDLIKRESNGNFSDKDKQVIKYIKKSKKKNNNIDTIPPPTELVVSTKSAIGKLTRGFNTLGMARIMKRLVKKDNTAIVGVVFRDIMIYSDRIKRKIKKRIKFYNQATVIIETGDNRNINIKFFSNFSVSMTGCKEDEDGINAMNIFLSIIKEHDSLFMCEEDRHKLKFKNYKITMINTNYRISFKLDRVKLHNILKEKYGIFVSYDQEPGTYPGVKIGYMWNKNNNLKDGICYCDKKCHYEKHARKKNICKLVTVAVFHSGNIIITGANDIIQTKESYDYINKILYKFYNEIVSHAINDV